MRFPGKSANCMANGHAQPQCRDTTDGSLSNGKTIGKVPRKDSEDTLETTEHYSGGTSEEYKNPALILVTLAPESSTKQCPTLKLLLKDQSNRLKNRAPAPPSIEHTESSASSLVDVDSPHISSVPSDFESQATQTRTQADRMAHEAEDKARETSNKASQKTKETAAEADQKASEASSKASGKAKEFSEYASEKSDELSKGASDKYDKAKKSAARNYKEGKEEAKEKGNELSRNRDNPVVIGNAVMIGAGVAALGVMGYQKHVKGELSLQVAGITAAAVGAFAIADYYVSQWLFENKNIQGSRSVLDTLDDAPVIHFTLERRGGTFEATRPGNDSVEMDVLLEELQKVEARFNMTRREVKGNKLVRKAKSRAVGGQDDEDLMGELALNGTWFARLTLGEPPQTIDLDLNMLTSDFYVRHTSSHAGTKYDDLFSKSFGSILGLAPSKHLRQIETTFLLHNLLSKGIVERPVFSLMLLSGHEGVLSIGATGAPAAEMVDKQIAAELDRAGAAEEKINAFTEENGKTLGDGTSSLNKEKAKAFEEKTILHKRVDDKMGPKLPNPDWTADWTWTRVQGAEGWWQTLLQGVWTGGTRVLQNQAVVVDINTPFILAPPYAAKTFYSSVAGSRQLDPPYSNFYAFPCMNPPFIEFEFSGTRFAMTGGRGMEYASAIIPGGKFSLGRMAHGGGYCVGAIVETRMGLAEEKERMTGSGKQGLGSAAASVGNLAGNGMRDPYRGMDPVRKRELRDLNARTWAGESDVFQTNPSLDSSLKKNTAYIKRLRTVISASSATTFVQETRSLSLHKYLSEIISASYEGLCKVKSPGEIAAGVEAISALHQRFGPTEFTIYLGWLLGRGMSTPDKLQLKSLGQDAREKEEKERLTRQRVLLKVITELWLVGVLRSLDDVARPEDAAPKAKENVASSSAKMGEATGKTKLAPASAGHDRSVDAEAFPLEMLKDLLGHDKEHTNLPLAVLFVKTFAWDVLGVKSAFGEGPKVGRAKDIQNEVTESGNQSSAEEEPISISSYPPLTKPELQQRFRNVLDRYFVDVKSHIVRDHKNIITQGKRNAEAYVKSGEVFEDRQANHDKQLKAQEKLISNAQVLCDALENQEMPELGEDETQFPGGATGIGLVKTGEYLRGQAEGPGIWEDEEERRFYENLIDLQDRVPGILLEDAKKKKADEDAQVGKKSDGSTVLGEPSEEVGDQTDDQSTAIANKTVGAQVDAILARLPELQTREQVDQLAIDFCFLNSKASRNRLAKAFQEIPKGRSDLLPVYSRLVATLGRYMTDLSTGLINYLDDEFRSLQRRKQKDFLGQARTGNVRYLAELTKFGVVPEHVIFHCLKVSLDDFSRMNIEIIGNLLENCGRYLLRNPDSTPRMTSFLETLQRKKAAQHLGQQERMMIENAVYYVNPPERPAIQQKEKTPMQQFISKLVYLDMNRRTYPKVLKSIRKLHWEEPEVVEILEKIFSKPGKVKFSNLNLLAYIVSQLGKFHHDFEVAIIDNILEHITLGLEQNDFKFNQRRIAEVKYLAELYSYKAVDAFIIFDTLYRIVTFGYPGGTPMRGYVNSLDMPDDFFRVRLVCTMLDFCGGYFDRGSGRKKLDFFLTFFQYYISTKERLPMDIDFIVQDSYALTRPQWKLITDFEEAGQAFASLVKQNYKPHQPAKAHSAASVEDDASSSDGENRDDVPLPEMEDAQVSSDEGEAEPLTNGEEKHESDFEDDIVVTRQEEERDPEAEAEFDRELAKMMSESLDSRKFERKALFDVPLPMRRAQRETMATGENVGNDGAATPTKMNTTAFSLMTKKGNRQQTRTIEMPSDSQFAMALKSQKEAERAEQQRIKDLVLNYDLTDSSADQAGIENSLYLDHFSYPNPNLSHSRQRERGAHHDLSQGPGVEKQQLSQQPHNAPLHQSPVANGANNRPTDRSGGGRRGHQTRKLQLSDVDCRREPHYGHQYLTEV
ncbi:MAG: hypothetical protein L6R37_000159 [Teloschistes peruensis]|nr:MAG: hypothetical protein L6R37_000159 [Teloschistes peruensis]